jgi:hypothetical protein
VAQASVSGADLAAGPNTLTLTAADGIRVPAELTLALVRDDQSSPDGGIGCQGRSCVPDAGPASDEGPPAHDHRVGSDAPPAGDGGPGQPPEDGGPPRDAPDPPLDAGTDAGTDPGAASDGIGSPDAPGQPDQGPPDGRALDGGVLVDPQAPYIVAITPGRGSRSGGTRVQLLGERFQSGVQVFFGGRPRPGGQVRRHGTQRLDVVSPLGDPGPVTVTVENVDGRNHSVADGFVYDP